MTSDNTKPPRLTLANLKQLTSDLERYRTFQEEYLYQFIGDISFTGDIDRFQSSLNPAVLFTDAVEHVADAERSYWIVDAIAVYLTPRFLEPFIKVDPRIGEMSVWRLTVASDRSAVLEARANTHCEPFFRQTIEYTDFSLHSIEIWAAFAWNYWTLFLPREYLNHCRTHEND